MRLKTFILVLVITILIVTASLWVKNGDKHNGKTNISPATKIEPLGSIPNPFKKASPQTKEKEIIETSSLNKVATTSSMLHKVTNIELIVNPMDAINFDKIKVTELIDTLLLKAESGDLEANYIIGAALLRCIDAAASEEELEEQIDHYYQTTPFGYEAEHGLKDKYRLCEGVDSELVSQSNEFISYAADGGYILALHAYWSTYIPLNGMSDDMKQKKISELKERNRKYVNRGIELGSVFSALQLGLEYYSGGLYAKNLPKAYAYIKLANSYLPNKSSDDLLERIKEDVYLYEIDDGEQMYKKLFEKFGRKSGIKIEKGLYERSLKSQASN